MCMCVHVCGEYVLVCVCVCVWCVCGVCVWSICVVVCMCWYVWCVCVWSICVCGVYVLVCMCVVVCMYVCGVYVYMCVTVTGYLLLALKGTEFNFYVLYHPLSNVNKTVKMKSETNTTHTT
jgi:hypothetical protein